MKSEIDKIFQDNQIMKETLDKQDFEISKMMEEIANLQDVGKKAEI